MNDKPYTNNFYKALEVLKITDWKFEGTDPTNETEFKAGFKKVTGDDGSGGAVYTDDPSKFGITWAQIKAEMDKL